MIISKKCLNCGHVAQQDINMAACPACSAIYNKVEAALTQSSPRPHAGKVRLLPCAENFIATLRAEGNYPNFRLLIKLATWFFYLLSMAVLLGAVFSGGEVGSARMAAIAGALIMVVVATAAKEASLMLADLSDATVRMAERQERDTHGT